MPSRQKTFEIIASRWHFAADWDVAAVGTLVSLGDGIARSRCRSRDVLRDAEFPHDVFACAHLY